MGKNCIAVIYVNPCIDCILNFSFYSPMMLWVWEITFTNRLRNSPSAARQTKKLAAGQMKNIQNVRGDWNNYGGIQRRDSTLVCR